MNPKYKIIIGILILLAVFVVFIAKDGTDPVNTPILSGDNLIINTDKTEYQKGEPVGIAVQNNGDEDIMIANVAIEKYLSDENKWEIIDRDIQCPCLVACEKVAIITPTGSSKNFLWNQETDKLPENMQEFMCLKANSGKYRAKVDYYEYDQSKPIEETPEIKTIYSDEFEIK